ncbi:MAG: TIGR04282 family arsenosugar biosynthesis glycosyltransferase [Blastocatellia bacterium]
MKDALVVMAKAPVAGTVKTRLIPALGAGLATELYVAFLNDTFATLQSVREELEDAADEADADYTLSLILCYTPAGAGEAFENVEREGSLLIAQRGENLGERIRNCFSDLFARGYENVIILGADSPSLPGEYVLDAFDELDAEGRVIIGPSRDGGYYLIGARRDHPALFTEIPWSTDAVLAETQKRANAAGLEIVLLPEWYDVDTPEELELLRAELRQNSAAAPRTWRVLKSMDKAGPRGSQ